MKKLLIAGLILAIAATFVNDLGAFVNARRILVEATREAAGAAAAASSSRDVAARVAADKAAERDVEVYLYDQEPTRVHVWARTPVEGTLVYGRARAIIAGEPLDTEPQLEHYESRPAQ